MTDMPVAHSIGSTDGKSAEKLCIPCPICASPDQWKNVDQYRIKASGMCLCMKCGMITYPEIIAKTTELKAFYREEYRDVPNIMSIFAGQRKLHYHNEFLAPVFDEWKKSGRDSPVICDIGAAFGMFLNWTRNVFPKGTFHGTELTLSYRRNSFHEYGLYLDEDFNTSLKYDFISSYKVAEHIPYVDRELRKYALALTENGALYISVPVWFWAMTNFGQAGFNIEYYYHKNHINVWTKTLFETLLKKCGLRVVKQNHSYYDSTYLCTRDDSLINEAPIYEDPIAVLSWLEKVSEASRAFETSKFVEACQLWPNFPDAQIARYESNRAAAHKGGFETVERDYILPMLSACPESSHITLFCADLCMRYSQWEKAIELIELSVKLRPQDPPAMLALAHCFRQMAEKSTQLKDKVRFFKEAREVTKFLKTTSFQNVHDAQTWIMNDNSRLPMKGEEGFEFLSLPVEKKKA